MSENLPKTKYLDPEVLQQLGDPQLSLPPVVTLLANLPLSADVLYRFISALRFP